MFQTGLYFVLFAFVMKNVWALSDEHKANIRSKLVEIGTECYGVHPLSEDDITSFKKKEFPNGDNAGCFVACVFNKAGLFDNNGTLSQSTAVEQAKTIIDDQDELNNLEEFLSTCVKVNEVDIDEKSDDEKSCDRAKLAYECLVENSEQFGYNFD